MCGRFYVDDETAREIERLTREVDERIKREAKKGDIHPTETAVVLSGEQGRIVKNEMCWGFPGIKDAKVLINARAESALDKKLFRQNVLSRRLIIPAAGFYEWNQNKWKSTRTHYITKLNLQKKYAKFFVNSWKKLLICLRKKSRNLRE